MWNVLYVVISPSINEKWSNVSFNRRCDMKSFIFVNENAIMERLLIIVYLFILPAMFLIWQGHTDCTTKRMCRHWLFNLKKVLRHFKHKLLKDSYVPIYNQFINEITKYDTIDDSKYVADLCMPLSLNRIRRFRSDFDNLKEVDFEFLKIPVFVNYDRNLRMLWQWLYETC